MELLKLDEEKLREACNYGDMDLIRFLINRGVDVNSHNSINGWSSLHWACKRGQTESIKLLLSHGADPNIKNFKNETPAQLTSKEDILMLLGAPITTTSHFPTVDLSRLSVCESPEPAVNSSDQSEVSSCPDQAMELNPFFSHEPPPFTNGISSSFCDLPLDSLSRESCSIQTSPHRFKRDAQTSTYQEDDNKELILKVRVSDIKDPDFIEVDIPVAELSYSYVLAACARELVVNPQFIERLRKLPNTRLRNDKDVQRLKNFDELELVVKGVSSCYKVAAAAVNATSSSLVAAPASPLPSSTKNNFQSISNFKNQTILY